MKATEPAPFLSPQTGPLLLLIVVRFLPYSAMALWPFILLKRPDLKDNAMLIHHERIHHRQQLELLIVPFYLLYVLHYLFNLCRYRQHDRAYREIVFEREAYACEADATYLHGRKLWAFVQYFGG